MLFVTESITETVLSLTFVTYTFVPSGLTATPPASGPTFTVEVVFVGSLNTEISLLVPIVGGTRETGIISLVSGSVMLISGSVKFFSSSVRLFSGSVTLFSGSVTLFSGSVTLFSGSVTLFSGSVTLFSGSVTLFSGSVTLSSCFVAFSPCVSPFTALTATVIADITKINVKTQSIFCVMPDVCFPIDTPQTLSQFDSIQVRFLILSFDRFTA
jgi:hypothetical protein